MDAREGSEQSFGDWLRHRRRALDLTQAELARKVGCSTVTLRKLEYETRRPSKQMAERLAEALQVSPAERPAFLRHARGNPFATLTDSIVPVRPDRGDRPRHNLLLQLTSFIGREMEIQAVLGLVAESRLVTLTGAGGSGKTRLALEAAVRLEAAFIDGAWLVDLAPQADARLVPQSVAATLGLVEAPGRLTADLLVDHLRPRQLLLLLDNCEHLAPACAELAQSLLHACPRLTILATSREPLRISGEEAFLVPLLAPPNDCDAEVLETLANNAAVRLFVSRARVQLTSDNAPAVARVCRQLDGLPLAIELAAPWLKVMSYEQIAAELQQGLDLLATRLRDAPARHQSMRTVFDQSWRLLASEERQVMEALSVFRGSFSRDAVECVAGGSLVIIAALVDKSLLRQDVFGRYGLHELVRQYAGEQLERSGATEAIAEKHGRYYAAFVNQRWPDLKGRRQRGALHEMDAEFDNVCTAWNWATTHRRFDIIALGLDGVTLYCELRDRFRERGLLLKSAEAGLAPEQGSLPHPVWGRLLARTALDESDPQHRLDLALDLANVQQDPKEVAYCLRMLGQLAHRQQEYERSRRYLEESLDLCRRGGDAFEVADALYDLLLYDYRGGAAHYRARAEECLRLRRAIGDEIGMAWSLGSIAFAEAKLGHYAKAERPFRERIELCEEIGKPNVIALSYAHLSRCIYFIAGQFELAKASAEQALAIADKIHGVNARSWALTSLGLLACMAGDYSEGRRLCEEAGAADPWADITGYVQLGLAIAALGLNRDESASQALVVAMSYAVTAQNWVWMIACLPVAALVSARQGQLERAAELMGLALTYPLRASGWMEKWPLLAGLRADLEKALGAETYQQAWAAKKNLSLEQVVTLLHREFDLPIVPPSGLTQ